MEFNEAGMAELAHMVRERVIEPWVLDVGVDAERLAPVKTGALAKSIDIEIVDDYRAMVGSDLPYAASVELGSRAHEIPGAFGREGSVMHPGGPAQPFLRPAGFSPAKIKPHDT